jgi:hypothetical protein
MQPGSLVQITTVAKRSTSIFQSQNASIQSLKFRLLKPHGLGEPIMLNNVSGVASVLLDLVYRV